MGERIGHARAVVVAEPLVELQHQRVVVGSPDVERHRDTAGERREAGPVLLAELRGGLVEDGAALPDVRRRHRRGRAQRRVQLQRHQHVAALGVNVVGADRDARPELTLIADRQLVGLGYSTIGVVPAGAGISQQRSGNEQRVEQRPVERRPVDQHRIGRHQPLARIGIGAGQREGARERARERRAGEQPADQLEVRLLEEPPVAAANQVTAAAAQVVRRSRAAAASCSYRPGSCPRR